MNKSTGNSLAYIRKLFDINNDQSFNEFPSTAKTS